MQSFSATLNDPALTFQYNTTANPTVSAAFKAAKEELKRQRPGEHTDDIVLLGVKRSKQIVQPGDGDEKLRKGDSLELQRDSVPLREHDARRNTMARLSLEPSVINLAYVFMSRVVSGKPCQGETSNRPAHKFLHADAKNMELMQRLLTACDKEQDPQQFVDAADDNYAMRQGHAHNTSDEWLKRTAADLRSVGALGLFRETHPFQCMIMEHMDAMLAAL